MLSNVPDVVPPLGCTSSNADAKGSQVAPSWTWPGLSWCPSHHCNLRSVWNPASTWAQVGPKIAQIEELFGGSPGPSWAQPGPILHVYLHYFHCFFPFDEGSCKAMFPTLGLSWAQLRQMPPHRTNSCVLSPTCRTPVGLKLGPSWSLAQVRPKLACDQV